MPVLRASSLTQRVVVLSLAGLLSACGSDSTAPVADPVGTVSSAIRTQGQGAFLIDFDLGTVMTVNSGGVADLYLDGNVNFNVGCCVPAGAREVPTRADPSGLERGGVFATPASRSWDNRVGCYVALETARRVAEVGAVSGLGAVTTIPTAGFVSTLSATVGHGYVVTDNARNWRVFVTSTIVGATSGGVIGVNIKWAPL